MSNVIPLRSTALFRRVVVAARDGQAHIFLAGPVWGGKPRPFRWVGTVPAGQRHDLYQRVRCVAERFALDIIEDRTGFLDPQRGPVTYSLSAATAR